jgi:hypothetical protein
MPLVTHQNNPQALGEFHQQTETITLLAGSILLINPGHQEVHDNIAASYAAAIAAIAAGQIARNGQGQYVVINPIPDLAPARAHVFATGLRGNGRLLWLLENGDSIAAFLEGEPQGPGGVNEEPEEEEIEGVSAEDNQTAPPPVDLPHVPPPSAGFLPPDIPDDCLSLYRLPPLPDYLRVNRHRILALGVQELPEWNRGYDNFQQPVMQRLRYAFPERRISRLNLVALFESWHDPVLCLVAAMIWGGISIEGQSGDNLTPLLEMGEPVLRARMEALRALIRSGAVGKAFKDCSAGGPLKFDGVDYVFFTKLFYFTGQVQPVLTPGPLILDRWTSNAFLVLGYQVCPSPLWERRFNIQPLLGAKPANWRGNPGVNHYRLYVAWFNHWAQLLGTSAAQLEQFVFGWDRRLAGNVWWNPRNQLISLGRSLFFPHQ